MRGDGDVATGDIGLVVLLKEVKAFERRGLVSVGWSRVDIVGEGSPPDDGELCWLADCPSVDVVVVGLEKD
jgi:hypothetical protein